MTWGLRGEHRAIGRKVREKAGQAAENGASVPKVEPGRLT